jgi:hypothetical protein
MKRKLLFLLIVVLIPLTLTSPLFAGLIDKGGGLIYDTDLDITWLQNANYAGTTMYWDEASQWAQDLVYQGYNDWRLPSALNQDGSGPDSTFPYMGGDPSLPMFRMISPTGIQKPATPPMKNSTGCSGSARDIRPFRVYTGVVLMSGLSATVILYP